MECQITPNWIVRDMPNCTGGLLVWFRRLIWNAGENGAKEKETEEEREKEGGGKGMDGGKGGGEAIEGPSRFLNGGN